MQSRFCPAKSIWSGAYNENVVEQLQLTPKIPSICSYVDVDVRTLLKDDNLLNSIAPATFAEYNNTQYIKVDSPKGHKVRYAVIWRFFCSMRPTASRKTASRQPSSFLTLLMRLFQVLITKFGDLGNNEYLDPIGGIAFTYDHIKQVRLEARKAHYKR